MNKIQHLCKKNVQEVKNLYGNINQIESKNKDIWKLKRAIKENIKDNKHWISLYMAIIIAVYRSPSSSKAEFCDNFRDILEEICERNNDILIVTYIHN